MTRRTSPFHSDPFHSEPHFEAAPVRDLLSAHGLLESAYRSIEQLEDGYPWADEEADEGTEARLDVIDRYLAKAEAIVRDALSRLELPPMDPFSPSKLVSNARQLDPTLAAEERGRIRTLLTQLAEITDRVRRALGASPAGAAGAA